MANHGYRCYNPSYGVIHCGYTHGTNPNCTSKCRCRSRHQNNRLAQIPTAGLAPSSRCARSVGRATIHWVDGRIDPGNPAVFTTNHRVSQVDFTINQFWDAINRGRHLDSEAATQPSAPKKAGHKHNFTKSRQPKSYYEKVIIFSSNDIQRQYTQNYPDTKRCQIPITMEMEIQINQPCV